MSCLCEPNQLDSMYTNTGIHLNHAITPNFLAQNCADNQSIHQLIAFKLMGTI